MCGVWRTFFCDSQFFLVRESFGVVFDVIVHDTLFVFYPYNIFHQAFSFNEGEHFNAVQNRLNVPSASLNVICGGEDHLRSFSLSKQFFCQRLLRNCV